MILTFFDKLPERLNSIIKHKFLNFRDLRIRVFEVRDPALRDPMSVRNTLTFLFQSHKADTKYYTPTTSRNLVKCTKLLQCIAETYKIEGFRGLYRGLSVTIYKASMTNIVTFTTYELICYVIRQVENK